MKQDIKNWKIRNMTQFNNLHATKLSEIKIQNERISLSFKIQFLQTK